MGNGPYEAYPFASALSEFGIWSLDRDDLYFPGNRTGVRLVRTADSAGVGIAAVFDGTGGNVAFERAGGGTVLSLNCICAGKGGKFVPPMARRQVKAGEPYGAALSIYALGPDDEDGVRGMFDPGECRAFRPFFKSYDD